ncbi:hypothetical protein [Pacificoceanicola onchidii]|uniref:hypothetical protein n=1 Tax=Pacificoceanicola onchidii TaxID=2562685 RepID=UPI0010A6958C|nr:hypothetical protein [Pacificoceanicola onchidii]
MRQRKTLFIHVGHYKTGTTALQVFLGNNARKLRRHGLDYTDLCQHHQKHSMYAFALYRAARVKTLMHGYNNPTDPETLWGRLFEAVEASASDRVMISTEEFMRLGAYPAAAERLGAIIDGVRDQLDFRIIAYLRSPDAHLRSWYNQMVKMGATTGDYNHAVQQGMEPVHSDYALALKPWVEIFGAEAVIVRPYHEKMRENGGLFRDFLPLLGFDYDKPPGLSSWSAPQEDVNPRMDDRLLELSRALKLAEVPNNVAPWVVKRAGEMLERQDAEIASGAQSFEAVIRTVEQGLDGLADLPGSAVDIAAFKADLPRAEVPWRAELGLVLATLLREQNLQRESIHKRMVELRDRVAALEARLEGRDS